MNLTDRLAYKATRLIGKAYLIIDDYVTYDNREILGIKIDKDIQDMSRRDLCDHLDEMESTNGFYELPSTQKIRLGAQLLRNYIRK